MGIAVLLAASLSLAQASPPASAPASSTAPAAARAAPVENPWSLSYGLDRRGNRYGRVDYRLRWSFEDLRAGAREPLAPRFSAERTLRGVLQGSRVELYGVRMRPFRDLALEPRESFSAPGSSAAAASAGPEPRVRLPAWERLYEDLERNARREAERFLIREGFDRTLPGHKGVPFDQKRALGEGLLDLGRGGLGEREDSP